MKKIEDINELRNIQMGILNNVHRFCQERGLTYFLSSGSLIGAVRHGGYIPWDDDIDIYMLRTDYERLMSEYTSEGHYKLLDPDKEQSYYYTFAKMIDTRTLMVEDETTGYQIGVYIDIFPIDYVPDDEQERLRVYKKKRLLYKIRRCKISKECCLHSPLAYWCYKLLPISAAQITRMIANIITNKQPTQYACNMTEAGPHISHCFPSACMDDTIDIKFEDRTYRTMVGYKKYLSCTYGDYMTLPPEEERQTHKFKAYWKDS